jgi:hypothetical protein
MTFLARLLHRFRWRSHLPQLADEIVDQIFEEVWLRVAGRVMQMSAPESRGYTRVLAAQTLRYQSDLCLSWLQLPAHWQPQLVALATERLEVRVVQRALSTRDMVPIHRRAA